MTTTRRACLNAMASAVLLLGAAQAQAMNFSFSQAFNGGGFTGTVSGTFAAVDANANTVFEVSEITFLTFGYSGNSPIGVINLSYTPPDIQVVGPTEWYAADQFLGTGTNGFFLAGTSATGTQMTWVAGPLNVFDYGNFGGSGGDAQNSTYTFGQIDLFSSGDAGGTALGTAQSDQWANIVATPVPEPASYLMMLGGVAAMVLRSRRKAD